MTKTHFNLEPGKTLGRNYFVERYLGGGWEGEVYMVAERHTGVLRAAKIYYPHHKRTRAQMSRYARKLYKLRDCAIVSQYLHRDIARVGRDQVEVMVSDLAPGEMLSSFLTSQKQKRLTEFEALHLLYAIVAGVEQIHYLGEYHGDIHSNNIMVSRKGLGFEVRLLDFFDLGRSSARMVFRDVVDLINLLFEMIGGARYYPAAHPVIKGLIRGRKHNLIRERYRNAGQLRLALDNLDWDSL